MLTKYNVFRAEDNLTVVPIRSSDLGSSEISWFSALCSDDYQFLGIPEGKLRSNWEHCSKIVKNAENNANSILNKHIDELHSIAKAL